MSYLPDNAAAPEGTAFTRQLSQRDLSLQVPINYVAVPGVALTGVCFPNQRYEDALVVKCLSNLLAVGFRRFAVDLYWDVSRGIWSLCPAQLGNVSNTSLSRRDGKDAKQDMPIAIGRRQDSLASQSLTFASMFPQQESSSLNSVTTTITSTPGTIAQANTTTSSAEPAATLAPGTLIDVGPYSCTRSTNLGLLLDVISSNLYTTQTNVNATLKYLIFNLHEATAAGSASVNLTDARLPQGDAHLGAIFNSPTANLSSFLYTPADLASQREDLNASFSWFGVNPSREPLPGYFDTEQRRGNAMTPNGWPAESFVELTQAKRLLVGLGTVDAELKGYNHSADAGAIFGPGYLEAITSVDITRNGVITDGCFFGPQDTAVSSANNSWAFVDLNQNRIASLSLGSQLAARLTRCGITPLLNSTLGGVTADKDWRPYEGFIQNTIWSWAEGQPWNSTDPNAEDPGLSNRCAVLNGASGRWQTENCGASHHSACRSPGQPYIWSIGRVDATYDEAGFSCKDESQFDAPRTALENRYLLQAWRNAINDRNLQDDKLLWVNFNDLDAKACWVIGQNATCPYLQDMNRERIVIVPTVAGIVVFVLAALTVFIKCASNRQNTKRRRKRMDDGWEYEGVPS